MNNSKDKPFEHLKIYLNESFSAHLGLLVLIASSLIISISGLSSSIFASSNVINITGHQSTDISISGTVSSNLEVFHGSGLEQSYFILPIKNENSTYAGILTFTSSKPVQIQSINVLTINNSLKLPVQFGTLYTFPINSTFVIPSNLLDEPKDAGTVQFSGNALRVITNEPFLITYSFSGKEFDSQIKNNLQSALEVYKKITGKVS